MDLNLEGYVFNKSTSKDIIQLSNDLLLEIHNRTHGPVRKFINNTKIYERKVSTYLEEEKPQAHIAASAEAFYTNFKLLYNQSCKM